jgi:hypothetical protein
LQARICLAIVRERALREFDLLYFTQNDNELDRTYFARLATLASRSDYIHVRRRRPDILNHVAAIWRVRSCPFLRGCSEIYLGSVDSLVFRHILSNNPAAVVHGFDDGAGNISPDTVLHTDRYRKAALYGTAFHIPSTQSVKRRISQFFSIYPDFDNIVSRDKITPISLFQQVAYTRDASGPTFFIGQPFTEYLSPTQIQRLQRWLAAQQIDFYVLHPREAKPLISDLLILDKRGELAEDAILAAAKGAKPRIIGSMTSVLFNLSSAAADKVYLSLGSGELEMEYRRLAQKAGAVVLTLADDGAPGALPELAALRGDAALL